MSADHDDRTHNFCQIKYHFVRSKCVFVKLQYYGRGFSENAARSRWSSKQILSDHVCFCSIIWSVIDLIKDPDDMYDNVSMMTLWWNISGISRVSQICYISRHTWRQKRKWMEGKYWRLRIFFKYYMNFDTYNSKTCCKLM